MEIGFILTLMGIFSGPKFFAISLGTFVAYFAWIFINTRKLLPLFKEGFQLSTMSERYQLEQLMLYDTIKQFSRSKMSQEKYSAITKGIEDNANYTEKEFQWQNLIGYVILGAGQSLLFGFSAFEIFKGRMSIGAFLFALIQFEKLRDSVNWLGFHMRTFGRMISDQEAVYHLLQADPQVKEKEDAKEFVLREGEIEFKNLGFSHYYVEEKDDTNV